MFGALASGVWRNIKGHARLISCIAAGFATYALLGLVHFSSAGLCAWNFGVLLYIAASGVQMSHATPHTIRRRAELIDESRFIVLAIAVVTVVASYAAIIGEVLEVKAVAEPAKSLHLALAVLTIVSGWFLIHVVFAMHYAHEYFLVRDYERDLPEDERGGLKFPGLKPPDYADFLYFSFITGVASQTADVSITAKSMRRLNLIHAVVSFFFNATVLAMIINIAASYVGR